MPTKVQRTEAFKHLLWRRHSDVTWLHGTRPELLTSDGREVRRLSSQHQHIAFQAFENTNAARDITTKVESSVAHGVALLGYSMFDQHQAIAILHTADGLNPGWVAFPHQRTSASTIPTLPIEVADMPKLRLVGGAAFNWVKGSPVLDAALEQRGKRFSQSPFAFNIIEHIRKWEVLAQVGRSGEMKQLRIVRKSDEPEIRRTSDTRLGGRFPIDEVLWREFSADPTFKIWFVVTFDRELMCLPDEWLSFWMQVDLTPT